MKLGELLRRTRDEKGWSLREVERRTKGKVSNGYLSLIETGEVEQPSPHILYTIATGLGLDYATLMELAGYHVPERRGERAGLAFSGADDLNEEERKNVEQYIEWVRHNRK